MYLRLLYVKADISKTIRTLYFFFFFGNYWKVNYRPHFYVNFIGISYFYRSRLTVEDVVRRLFVEDVTVKRQRKFEGKF